MFSLDAAKCCFAWFIVGLSTLKEIDDDKDTCAGCNNGGAAVVGNG
jgi:hypothetical protein